MFRIFSDVHEVKKLDRHILEFLELLKKDAKTHDSKALKTHAEAFDREVHEELDRLIDITREDLKMYNRVAHMLAVYDRELSKMQGKQDSPIAQADVKYAELITRNAIHQLESLNNVFRRFRTR
ncbi:MAG: hypothetical protein ABIH41_03920 [Nanoarchaeota archaeon]